MIAYLELLRPKQWVKQVFVALPLLSLGTQLSWQELKLGMASIAWFTFVAASVYIFNDYSDLERDKNDLFRKNRPLAAGRVNVNHALAIAFFLILAGITGSFLTGESNLLSGGLLIFYLVVNLIYSKFALKNHKVLGIALVGVGFPLRFAYGCVFTGVQISYWAITMLMLLALFMLSIKRYQMTVRGIQRVENVDREFWLIAATTFAAFFSASYAGFVSFAATQAVWGTSSLLLSSIPVALGVVRFIELGTDRQKIDSGDATEMIVRDLPILMLGAIYVLVMFFGRWNING